MWGSKNHGVIESLELEEAFKGHLVSLPCSDQRYVQLDPVGQSPSSPAFECPSQIKSR